MSRREVVLRQEGEHPHADGGDQEGCAEAAQPSAPVHPDALEAEEIRRLEGDMAIRRWLAEAPSVHTFSRHLSDGDDEEDDDSVVIEVVGAGAQEPAVPHAVRSAMFAVAVAGSYNAVRSYFRSKVGSF